MRDRLIQIALPLALVVLTLFAIPESWHTGLLSNGSSHAKLRVGINPWPGYEPLYLAKVKGMYEAEGLDVDLVQFSTLDDSRRAFERGQLDGVAATLVDIVQVYKDTGLAPRIVLATDYSDGADVIISLNPQIKSVKQLKGKKVAAEQMFGRFVLQRALQVHGLSLDDVHVVESSILAQKNQLNHLNVDAVVTYPPASLQLQKTQGTRVIFTSAEIPGQIADVVAFRSNIDFTHPNITAKFQSVWNRVLEYLHQYRDESVFIMAEREGITVQDFEATLGGAHLLTVEENRKLMVPGGALHTALNDLNRLAIWPSAPHSISSANSSAFLPSAHLIGIQE